MSATPKMLLVIVAVLEVSANPLFQGISFNRGFEINFKPFEGKPMTFFREKWSPFGVFGRKFGIQKRSLDHVVLGPPARVPRPAAPVFEHIDEIDHIGTGPLFIIPKPMIKPPLPPLPPLPVPTEVLKPPPPSPKPGISSTITPPLPPPMPIIVNELPPLPSKPMSTNMVIIQPTKIINGHVSSDMGLYTDITQVNSVKEHLETVKLPPPIVLDHPPIPPPVVVPPKEPIPPPKEPSPVKEEQKEKSEPPEESKNEVLLKNNSLIRGSKMALQFGTVFLTLMAQFFDSARATLDQMTNPPPKFKN